MEQTIIKILEKSIEKHGADKPVTLGHLLGIIKLAKKIEDQKFMNSGPDLFAYDPEWD